MQHPVDRQTWHEVMVPNEQPGTLIPVRGNGSRLFDQQDRDYIDLTGGGGANLLGHCHPTLVDTLSEQARTLWHLSHGWTHEPALRLAQQLCAATFADRVLFNNTGTDANEAALRLALHYSQQQRPEKRNLIVFQGACHGQSLLMDALSDNHSAAESPLQGQITRLPFNKPEALNTAINADTAAVMVEPIQTEGGVRAANPEFLHALREHCDRHDVPLIFDEVQTGMGRTGRLFAYMHSGVIPDMLTCARALGGGFPLSALLTHRLLSDSCPLHRYQHGGAGNPLVCQVASRILELVSEPSILQGVQERHLLLRNHLITINQHSGVFQDIRGQGLLIGATLNHAWQGRAMEIAQSAEHQGVLVLTSGDSVIRFSPSLIIDPQELHHGMERLQLALAALK